MSTSATDPTNNNATSASEDPNKVASPKGKGKSKAEDTSMEADDDEEEGDSEEEEDSDAEEDNLEEIDPSAIVGRRTRGVKVDYTSKEALEKAGLQGNEKDEDSDEDVEMKD